MKQIWKYIVSRRYFVAALLITAVAAIGWQISTWYSADDVLYMRMVPANADVDFWLSKGERITSFSQAIDSAVRHFHTINGRLANILYILFQGMPRTLIGLLNGLMILAMYVLMLNLSAKQSVRRRWLSLLGALLLWTALPWYDNMESADYIFNYVWSSVAALGAISLFSRSITSRSTFATTILLAFVAGWMHEGIALSMIAWFVVVLCTDHSERARRLFVTLAAIAGFVLTINVNTIVNARGHMSANSMLDVHQLVQYARELWTVWLAIVATVWLCVVCRCRNQNLRTALMALSPMWGAVCVGILLAVSLGMHARVLWGVHLFASIILLHAVSAICDPSTAPTVVLRRLASALWIAFATVYVLWAVQLIRYERINSRDLQRLHVLITASDSPIVPIDMLRSEQVPFYLMGMVRNLPIDDWSMNFTFTGSFTDRHRYITGIVPTRFAGVEYCHWDKIAGNNPFRGEYPLLYSDSCMHNVVARVKVSEPHDATPLNLLLMWIKSCASPSPGIDSAAVPLTTIPLLMPDGSYLYYYAPMPLPVTMQRRDFVALDVISAEIPDRYTEADLVATQIVGEPLPSSRIIGKVQQ